METGLIPDDEKWIGNMVKDICYYNAEQYFKFDQMIKLIKPTKHKKHTKTN